MELFLNQIEVLGYKIDGADDNFVINSIPVTLFGAPSDYFPVTITGLVGANDHCDVYLACGENFTGSFNMYVENYPTTSSLDISMISVSPSLDSLFNTLPIFITTSSDTIFDNAGELYITVATDSRATLTTTLDVSVTNEDDKPYRDLNVFLMNEYLSAARALKLHIRGDGLYDGYIPYLDSLFCYIERSPADMINVFLQGVENTVLSTLDLMLEGKVDSTSTLDISLPYIADVLDGNVEINIEGY
jgi:hypothetical protein